MALRKYCLFLCLGLVLIFVSTSFSEELPRPTYDNSLIFAMTYGLNSSASEINIIKNQFGNGIYAPLYFTHFVMIEMDWSTLPANADAGIQSFKNQVENLIAKAKEYEVGLHIIINYGLSRNVNTYKEAKEEDIRNGQWYNDNNLAAANQLSGVMNDKVFGTFSRYARKLREFHEAKIQAMFDFLKQKQDDNPDLAIVVSGPGEAELNFWRIDDANFLQTDFCDYSSFAVLEFRDWIRHAGMYAAGCKYEGEGYANGGARYQGANGLQNFNSDFGTNFSNWALKYYNWSLQDSFEGNAIPFANYFFDGQMPDKGPYYIEGGFDPPREMKQKGEDVFWDLWHSFRELLVAHYVKDMASIGRDSGFPKNQYYTHQIPADHLFGTRPDDPLIPFLNPRYYTSASPMWTADAFSDIGMAITLYDLKINANLFFRTSRYADQNIKNMSSNWAALEYNPEVHAGTGIPMSSVQDIYERMIRLYENDAHMISFFYWMGNEEWQYKGTNRELATVQFLNAIKDCARQSLGVVFTPPVVNGFTGAFNGISGEIDLDWSDKIWSDLNHKWSHWDDFKEFVIFRGYSSDFACNPSSEIGRVADISYSDAGFDTGRIVYYKIAAVNINGYVGSEVSSGPINPSAIPVCILNVSRASFIFAANPGGDVTSSQQFMVLNEGTADMTWTAVRNASWLECSPVFGTNAQVVSIIVNPSGLSQGIYYGSIIVSSANALNSPQFVNVTLKVLTSSQTQPPIGYWDTPVDGATHVRGQIPVTGWALDDIEVDRVEIWRRAEPEDPPEAINPDGLVPVGTALFVEGARPNLETDPPYNQYPFNYKGGWGYMLLTYGMARRGNGTYVLHAFVWDKEGNRTDLGTKTITCDNDNAVKPFGTLDTPAPGMAFPHLVYGNINFGWVLTPQPKYIPFDGSTVYVYIDGELKGNLAEYGNYSASVAAMFPGYANTNNSYGHYFIDLESYENGVHTIQWTAYDSDGVGEGIGSRYFNIQNTGGTLSNSGLGVVANKGYTSLLDLSSVQVERSGFIGVKRGYIRAALEKFYPDEKGVTNIEIPEVSRVEILLTGKAGYGSMGYEGYLIVGDELRPLPVGSSLDKEKGIFSWMPGAGFFGEYEFVFVKLKNNGINDKIKITIRITPK